MHIAYQVFGEGELDVVLVNGYVTHVELVWEHEPFARGLEGLASFARVITFDRRGSGLSDPVAEAPTLEERMDDVRAVMDAAGSERAALIGISEGVPMSILFAATYPDRVQALVCCGGMARSTVDDDYPWAATRGGPPRVRHGADPATLGRGSDDRVGGPKPGGQPREPVPSSRGWSGRPPAPGCSRRWSQMFLDIDVRDVVPSVHAPTLILHRRHDRLVNVRNGRWLAEHMPNARLVELPGR